MDILVKEHTSKLGMLECYLSGVFNVDSQFCFCFCFTRQGKHPILTGRDRGEGPKLLLYQGNEIGSSSTAASPWRPGLHITFIYVLITAFPALDDYALLETSSLRHLVIRMCNPVLYSDFATFSNNFFFILSNRSQGSTT